MKIIVTGISVVLATLLMTGCGGSGESAATTIPTTTTTPSSQQVSSLKILDINGAPIIGATVNVTSTTTAAPSLVPALVGDDGIVIIPALASGKYQVKIVKDGIESSVFLDIDNENFQPIASLVAPVQVNTDGTFKVVLDAIVASISGTVYDLSGTAIANAQVSISGGSMTNGTFASAITDANGAYQVFINVNKDLLPALLNSTMTASIPGYIPHSISGMQIMNKNNMSGVNFSLQEQTAEEVIAATAETLYTEDFEGVTSGWTVNKLSGVNSDNTWHVHTAGLDIINNAYTQGLVSLAPNDTSAAKIADPIGGTNCFWYGNSAADDAQGSFLDTIDLLSSSPLDGGTSLDGGNSGELISPVIDLTSVSGPVNVSFNTWWEVESVNPNANGFDLMTVSVSTDDGDTWKDLAKLNPLSDPVTELARAPIPFSNGGFNSAPTWLAQESIPLVGTDGLSVAGQTIKLKYTFNTNDSLFNGFRGWMIDDVVVSQGEGTFPLLNDSGTFDQYSDLGSTFFVLSVVPAAYDFGTDTWTKLTTGLATDFSVDLDYVSDVDTTFTLQLRDAMDDTLLADAIATQDGVAVAASDTTSTMPAPALSEHTSVKKASTFSEAKITLAGSVTVPSVTSGMVALWVVMKDSSTGSVLTEYPVEFYEVLVP